jgi:uracil-DNA glycosylase
MSDLEKDFLLHMLYAHYQREQRLAVLRAQGAFVPGHGLTTTPLMIVGEAPGAQEADEGIPFVGPSGQLLNTMLNAIGLPRQYVFVTNVVKYRPRANRTPDPYERQISHPYLREEIEIVDPPLVLLCGRVALDYLYPNAPVSAYHNQLIHREGRLFLPTYHPSAALRDDEKEGLLEQTFLQIKSMIE